MTILFLILGVLALGGGIACFVHDHAEKAPQQPPLLPPSNLSQPAIAQAWAGLENPSDKATAQHALMFHLPEFYGVFRMGGRILDVGMESRIDPATLAAGRAKVAALKAFNSSMKLGVQVGYTEARDAFTDISPDHAWWKRDAAGNRVAGWGESHLFNLSLPEVRQHCAEVCASMWATGLWDFIFLDVFFDDPNHIDMLLRIRQLLPTTPLQVNCNYRICPNVCPLVDGIYMEDGTIGASQWPAVVAAVDYNEVHVRQPAINVLEVSGARTDLELMARTTCLALTKMNGYVIYSDPITHLHTWYPLWDNKLGKPIAPPEPTATGWKRAFEHGTAFYTPSGASYITLS